jgi:HAMP domain-containing protein
VTVTGLPVLAIAWGSPTGWVLLVTLLTLAGALLSIASLWRLRRHYRVAEAAERLEAVDLSSIVRKYVPGELWSQKASEEIPLIKQTIGVRWQRWKRMAIAFGALALCSAAATSYLIRRNPETFRWNGLAGQGQPTFDVVKAVQGAWGWRADARQSCQDNPQTISLSPDGKTLSVDYAKSYWDRRHFEYAVVSSRSNAMVLQSLNSPSPSQSAQPTMTITFQDPNTFLLTRSDQPLATPGAIERCQNDKSPPVPHKE